MTHIPAIVWQVLTGIGLAALAPIFTFIWKQCTIDQKILSASKKWSEIFNATLGKIPFVKNIRHWVLYGEAYATNGWARGEKPSLTIDERKELAKLHRDTADFLES
jgi:hypothetical protein